MPHTLKEVLPATAVLREDGHLAVGGCDTVALAAELGTPLFVFCEQTFEERARALRDALPAGSRIYYAAKAFICLALARRCAEEGLGVDVASGGEMLTALRGGVPAADLVFHGNNKSDRELRTAVAEGVGLVVADALGELERIDAAAAGAGRRQRVLLRVTPGVEAHTHSYIQTGQEDSKFGMSVEGGVALEAAKRARDLPNIDVAGIHAHIGSNITGVEAFLRTVEILMEFLAAVRDQTGVTVEEMNLGGGLGIAYTREEVPARIDVFAREVAGALAREAERLRLPVPRLAVEPGRWLIGNAMVTLYRVGVIKEVPGIRTYVAVDGGMSDNIRPALYGARYEALVANKADRPPAWVVTVAGAHCEQGDLLIRDVALPADLAGGDVLAVPATGAYGYAMASNYNRFPRPAVVAVRDGRARVIVRRETDDDLLRLDEP